MEILPYGIQGPTYPSTVNTIHGCWSARSLYHLFLQEYSGIFRLQHQKSQANCIYKAVMHYKISVISYRNYVSIVEIVLKILLKYWNLLSYFYNFCTKLLTFVWIWSKWLKFWHVWDKSVTMCHIYSTLSVSIEFSVEYHTIHFDNSTMVLDGKLNYSSFYNRTLCVL